jgi:hypothetical protein
MDNLHSRTDQSMEPVRGILNGFVWSIALWLVIIAVVLWTLVLVGVHL